MTPRERYLAALAGEMPDKVPFVVWNNKLANDEITNQLLELQTCIINKSTVYKVDTPDIAVETAQLPEADGYPRRRKVFHTGGGDMVTVERITPGSNWLEKMPFTGPEDYEPLEAFVRGKRYTPCFDEFLADYNKYGDSSVARPETIYTPIQDCICKYMGVGVFCIEWADRRDRLMKLCEVIAEDRRKRLQIIADSPICFVIIEGNIITEVIGPERFEKYHLPYIEEACELLHAKGKYAGGHFDANNKLLADSIARTSLDMIESFTPPPDCDLPLGEARRVWPKKTVQINFPSSVHLDGPDRVCGVAAELVREASPGDRFVVGVSEDISEGGVNTLVPLARAVFDHGRTPVSAG
jgi:hypothetical protein